MAINNTYIISPDFVKAYAPFLNSNIDNDLLDLAIVEAQDIELQGILGTNLYESILAKINADTLSSNAVYSNLVDKYCVKVLLYYAIKRTIAFLIYKFNNKNIGEQSSDNTEVVEFKTLKYLDTKFDNDAADYSQKLINHLRQYGNSLYTEYNTESDAEDLKPNSTTKYNSGIDLISVSHKKYRRP